MRACAAEAVKLGRRWSCLMVLAWLPALPVWAAPAASPATAPVAAAPSLTLCFERKDVPPWRTVEGNGLNFVLLGQVASRLGLAIDYQSLPWKRCLAKLQANEFAGAFSVSFAHDRTSLGAFPGGATPDPSKRLHWARYQLVRRKGSHLEWDGKALSHVDGPIGFQLGYSIGEFLREQKVPTEELNLRAGELGRQVANGRLAGAAIFDTDVEHLMAGPLAQQLELLPLPLLEKPYFLMLSHKLVSSQPELAARIWKTIEEVRTSPAYQKLEREAAAAAAH